MLRTQFPEAQSTRPGDGPFGIMTVAGDLQLPVLPRVPEYCRAIPTEQWPYLAKPVSSKIKTPSPSLGIRSMVSLSAVEVLLVPVDAGQEPLESLLGGAGDDLGDGVAVLVGMLV